MSQIAVCRVCLIGNVKIHPIKNTELQIIYERLTNNKLTTKDGRPDTVCYLCHSQLQGCLRLKYTSEKSEDIMTALFLNNMIELTQESLAILNRELHHDFSTTAVDVGSYSCPPGQTVKEESSPVKEELKGSEIEKREVPEEISCDVAMCRVCMSDSAGRHYIEDTPLQAIYEKLTDYKVITADGRPRAVCYLCRQRLHKCLALTRRAGRSEKILNELSRNGIKLTQSTVWIFNRSVKSALGVRPPECAYYGLEPPPASCDTAAKQETIEEYEAVLLRDAPPTPKASKTKMKPKKVTAKDAVTASSSNENVPHKNKILDSKPTDDKKHDITQLPKLKNFSIVLEKLKFDPSLLKSPIIVKNEKLYEKSVNKSIHRTPINKSIEVKKGSKDVACDRCEYKCYSFDTLAVHKRFHDPKRAFSCDICSYRFKRKNGLRTHKRIVHIGEYECVKCHKKIAGITNLKLHMHKHSGNRVFPCDKCDKVFMKRVSLRNHYYTVHRGVYPCSYCDISFINPISVTDHVFLTHAGNFPFYICDICNKKFKDKRNVAKHISSVHKDRSRYYVCEICEKFFKNKAGLKQHAFTHTKPFECEVCNKRFSNKIKLNSHRLMHTGIKPFSCEICNKNFRDKYLLKHHLKTHIERKRHTCSVCYNTYLNKASLAYHMTKHGGKKSYNCEHCAMAFYHKSQLNSHLASHSDEKPYTCDICQNKFKRKSDIALHLSLHTGIKPHKCALCPKTFRMSINLLQHTRTVHYKLKPHACGFCDYRCASKDKLINHVRTHTGERPYVCDVCGSAFVQTSALKRHMLSHSKDKPYSCERCDRRFAEKRSLDAHTSLIHSDNETHICDLCNRVFAQRDVFKRHIKTHSKQRPYACNRCTKTFKSIKEYARHSQSHVGASKWCAFCDKTFNNGCSLRRHILTKHGGLRPPSVFACNRCEAPFDYVHALYRHIRIHDGVKPFACDYCDATFSRDRSRKRHFLRRHGDYI